MRWIKNNTFTNKEQDGIQFNGERDSDVVVYNCIFSKCEDELASVVKGATNIWFVKCTFKDNDKGVLCGTGDSTDFIKEQNQCVVFNGCVFDEVSRRSPYFRYGSVVMKDCYIKNWKGGYKTYGARFQDAKSVKLIGVHFIQDKFRIEPLNWLRGGGCWKGIINENSNIYRENVTKNKWWIKL